MASILAALSYVFLTIAALFWFLNICTFVEVWRIRRRGETRNISGFPLIPQLGVILSSAMDYFAGGTHVPNFLYWALAFIEIYVLSWAGFSLVWLKNRLIRAGQSI